MPTYQYACTECGHRFEAVQAFSDNALTECPNCSGKLRKVYGSVGVVFKGSGFYRNDARDSKSSSTLAKPAKESASKDSGSGDSGSSAAAASSSKDSSASSSSSASTSSSSSSGSSTSSSSSSSPAAS